MPELHTDRFSNTSVEKMPQSISNMLGLLNIQSEMDVKFIFGFVKGISSPLETGRINKPILQEEVLLTNIHCSVLRKEQDANKS